jgi:hypothetical protein
LPSLKIPIQGDDGGKGRKYFLTSSVAPVSKPANAVAIRLGRLVVFNESFTPGRAAPAAYPQTELTSITGCLLIEVLQ